MDQTQTPETKLVTCTRELIDELIAKDTKNRKKCEKKIYFLKREIEMGRWKITNQGIGVSVSDFIVDGGHRLAAMAKAEYPPIQFFLTTNLPDDAQGCVDVGPGRSMADNLTLKYREGVSSRVVAALTVLLKDEDPIFLSVKPSVEDCSKMYEKHLSALDEMLKIEKFGKLPAPVMAALFSYYTESQNPKVLDFTKNLITGVMLSHDNPILALRNWLDRRGYAGHGFAEQREKLEKTRYALTAYLEGRALRKLSARKKVLQKV